MVEFLSPCRSLSYIKYFRRSKRRGVRFSYVILLVRDTEEGSDFHQGGNAPVEMLTMPTKGMWIMCFGAKMLNTTTLSVTWLTSSLISYLFPLSSSLANTLVHCFFLCCLNGITFLFSILRVRQNVWYDSTFDHLPPFISHFIPLPIIVLVSQYTNPLLFLWGLKGITFL